MIKTITDIERAQAAEIERLTRCLKFEQNFLERIGTHGPGGLATGVVP